MPALYEISDGVKVWAASTIGKIGNIAGGRRLGSGRYIPETVSTLACGVDTSGRLQMFIVTSKPGAWTRLIDRNAPPSWAQLDLLLNPQPSPDALNTERLWRRRNKLCNRVMAACRHETKRSLGPDEWNRWAAWWAGTEAWQEPPVDTESLYPIEQGVSVWRASTRTFCLFREPVQGGKQTGAGRLDPKTISTLYWGIDQNGGVRLFIQTPDGGPRLLEPAQEPDWSLLDLLLTPQPENTPAPGSYEARYLWLGRSVLARRLAALCEERVITVLDGADQWRKWDEWFSKVWLDSLEQSHYQCPDDPQPVGA